MPEPGGREWEASWAALRAVYGEDCAGIEDKETGEMWQLMGAQTFEGGFTVEFRHRNLNGRRVNERFHVSSSQECASKGGA